MKKVLIFSTAYLPLTGGAEVATKELTDRMGEFEFDLITARIDKKLPRQEVVGRVNVHRIGFGFAFDKFLLPVLGLPIALRLHSENKYSLAWAIMASQAGVLAVLFSKIVKVKLLTTLQEGDEESHLKRYAFGSLLLFRLFIRPFHRFAIKKSDRLHVISDYLKARALESGAKMPIAVIPNGVDLTRFSKAISEPEKQNLLSSLGISYGEKVVLSVSRLERKNAIDVLVRSMEFVSAKCVIVGTGSEEEMIKKLILDLDIRDKVILAGNIRNEDIVSYYAIADVFARPSRSEGQGISFIEAMATGVPIVATKVGGIPDFLTDKETGIFCEVDDAKDLGEKIEELLINKELHKHISENAIKLVKAKYGWDKIALHIDDLFNRTITG